MLNDLDKGIILFLLFWIFIGTAIAGFWQWMHGARTAFLVMSVGLVLFASLMLFRFFKLFKRNIEEGVPWIND